MQNPYRNLLSYYSHQILLDCESDITHAAVIYEVPLIYKYQIVRVDEQTAGMREVTYCVCAGTDHNIRGSPLLCMLRILTNLNT